MRNLPAGVRITKTVDGAWMVLVNGFQWGQGQPDRSGAYSNTWTTRDEAIRAYRAATEDDENA
jgi:hypothetical protein